MTYSYNVNAAFAATPENLEAIQAPAVNRYILPWGLELMGVSTTGNQARHFPIPAILYVPIKMASTISVDRVGVMFTGANSCVDTWYYDVSLYTHNGTDNYPATKLADLGTFTYQPGVTSDGVQLITINQTLTANTTYWLAIGIRNNAVFPGADIMAGRTPWMYQQHADFAMFRKIGNSTAGSGANGMAWVEQPQTYSGTRPSSTVYANTAGSTAVVPQLRLRRSA